MIVWLHPAAVLEAHRRALVKDGGAPGLRDRGLLESALARPKTLAAYGEPDICDLAAGYTAALIRNHPFVDGNKRVGFILAYVFLKLNGWHLKADERDAAKAVWDLAAGNSTQAVFADWLKSRVTLRRSG